MTTARARNRRVLVYAAIAAAAVVAVWLINRNSVEGTHSFAKRLCLNVAQSRVQGNKRAEVIRTFLLVAARTRSQSAELERRSVPTQAANDLRAAHLYLRLADEVHPTPLPAC